MFQGSFLGKQGAAPGFLAAAMNVPFRGKSDVVARSDLALLRVLLRSATHCLGERAAARRLRRFARREASIRLVVSLERFRTLRAGFVVESEAERDALATGCAARSAGAGTNSTRYKLGHGKRAH